MPRLLIAILFITLNSSVLADAITACEKSNDEWCEANATEAELQQIDKKLNEEYKTLMHRLNPNQKKELIAAQKAWLTFRTLDCDAENSLSFNGLGAPSNRQVAFLSCMKEHTSKRVLKLKEFNSFFDSSGEYQ